MAAGARLRSGGSFRIDHSLHPAAGVKPPALGSRRIPIPNRGRRSDRAARARAERPAIALALSRISHTPAGRPIEESCNPLIQRGYREQRGTRATGRRVASERRPLAGIAPRQRSETAYRCSSRMAPALGMPSFFVGNVRFASLRSALPAGSRRSEGPTETALTAQTPLQRGFRYEKYGLSVRP